MSELSEPLVAVDGLTKQYGGHTALENCTLRVGVGEVFGLLGPNGAGKSTLLRILLGLVSPTSGSARIAGYDCWRQSLEVRRRTGYLPGEARLFRQLRGRDVLKLLQQAHAPLGVSGASGGASASGVSGGAVSPEPRAAEAYAERLKLDLSRRVFFMSTGMRQKLALIAVLSRPAELLILDEPTANLDPSVRGEVLDIVRERQAQGVTVVFSSHVLSEVEEVCRRVVLLRDGRVAEQHDLGAIRRRHRIQGLAAGEPSPLPEELASRASLTWRDNRVTLDVEGDLSAAFRWLADLKLQEASVEARGLQEIYDRIFQRNGARPAS